MHTRTQHNLRAQRILHAIVESYMESGEPVASRTLSKLDNGKWSPATIRNIMADLDDEGFLEQPHASAGRVPTLRAIRYYVESLAARRPVPAEVGRLRSQLRHAASVEERLERSSHILTELSGKVGIAALFPAAAPTLAQVELLLLSDRRVLMIVETSDHMVRNRVVSLEQPASPEELNNVRNYLNQHFSGWTLPSIRAELHRRLAGERADLDSLLERLKSFYQMGLLDLAGAAEVHLEGAANLVADAVQFNPENLRELFRTLEEKQRLIELLERFLEQAIDAPAVQVGLEQWNPSLRNLSLIGLTVTLPSGLATRVAVLGPLRMDYTKALSAVSHVGEAFQALSS
jgi:heat-inducible transcriptional repressor